MSIISQNYELVIAFFKIIRHYLAEQFIVRMGILKSHIAHSNIIQQLPVKAICVMEVQEFALKVVVF